MKITLQNEIINAYPDLKFGFIIGKNEGYKNSFEADNQVKTILNRLQTTYTSEEELRSLPQDNLYREFYRSMGLKAAKVSIPVKQAARVFSHKNYKSINRVVDIAMEIEYSTLISFQVYSFDKLPDELSYRFANQNDAIIDSKGDAIPCAPNELLLTGPDIVVHSPKEGNSHKYLLDNSSELFLIRAMKVPGISDDTFNASITEIVERLSGNIYKLDKDQPLIEFNVN